MVQETKYEHHYIRGHAKVKACTTLDAAVMMALECVLSGREQKMGSAGETLFGS